jgi:DNA repair exonuclease SbcCD ATPase subunit
MKRMFFSLFCLVSLARLADAQVREELRSMSQGTQNALTVMLPGASAKYAEGQWTEFVKSYGKLSSIKNSKEKVVSGIQVVEVSKGSTLNVYSLAEELGNDSKMLTWWFLDSIYVSSMKTPEAYAAAAKVMERFAHQVEVALANDEVTAQQKELDKRKSELDKLQKANTGLHKDIDTYTKKIEDAEKRDIPANLQAQEQTRASISQLQTSALGAAEQKELSKQMKQLDKLTKENESLHKSVRDNNDRIAKAQRDIETNLKDQETAKAALEEQEKLTNAANQKLLDIKARKPD